MIVIPDLFGSYQKGRDAAIEANWKDLQNYESIENARHQNDAAALANLATMADFGKKRRLTDNEVTNSDLNTRLNVAQMPAKLNIAEGDSLVTGVELATLLANQDELKQFAADKLATTFLGAGTGYNNAVVGHGKSTMGRDIFVSNYPALYDAYNRKTVSDITMMNDHSQHMPTINRHTLTGQLYTTAAGADTAKVDYTYAPQVAHKKNIAAITGYDAQTSGSRLAKSQSGAALVTLASDLSSKYQSEISLIQERQKNYPKGSNEWNNAQLEIDTRRKAINDLGGYFGVPDLTNYKPYAVYAPAMTGDTSSGATSGTTSSGATSGGTSNSGTPNSTGTKTVVDAATGRAIQVPTTPANLFGTSTPTTTGTRAVVTNNVMGGHNYGGTVSNWDALVNSDAGRFIQNLFTYNPNNGGGVVGLGIPQVRQTK